MARPLLLALSSQLDRSLLGWAPQRDFNKEKSMAVYSIDLGMDADSQEQNHLFPMQIELCSGELTRGAGNEVNGFTPTALASFEGIRSNDTIVLRVFDITGIGGSSTHSFTGNPGHLTFSFIVDPNAVNEPLEPFSEVSGVIASAGAQPCLSFAAGPNTSLPCFYKLESSNGPLITHLVNAVSSTTSYQMSIRVSIMRDGNSATYSTDPEVVVSPDPS